MLSFPNAKINIGLNVLSKRDDNFHNIETFFYPLPLHDILEIVPSSGSTELRLYGNSTDIPMKDNLVYKAWELLHKNHNIPKVKINLYKNIPSGAGLGGGSSDAAFCLKNLNKQFELKLNNKKLKNYALNLGSDCPFFIENQPAFAQGRGEVLTKSKIKLTGKYVALFLPSIEISTAEAYKNTIPTENKFNLNHINFKNPSEWGKSFYNSFENYVFEKYPEIKKIKDDILKHGAEYALLSGSGSAVYGIFNKEIPDFINNKNYRCKIFAL